MRPTYKRLLGAVAFLLIFSCSAQATETSPGYPEIMVSDATYAITAPPVRAWNPGWSGLLQGGSRFSVAPE